MWNKLQTGYQLWRHLGANWLGFRLRYALRQRTGGLKRALPAIPWAQQPLTDFLSNPALGELDRYLHYRRTSSPPFFFAPDDQAAYQARFAQWDAAHSPLELIEAMEQGSLRYFEHSAAPIGFPPQWHKNPFSGQTAPADRHWSDIGDFGYGDIKVIWEPSRFGFVYALVRAYWRTGDERYPALFWQLIEDWQLYNPPQIGPNWKCGQETSLRVMAWCFGLYGFLQASATTAQRVTALAQMIAVSGERIAANLDYALSQRNNHGISEGMGLWTIGLLFPEFANAEQWQKQGRTVLENLACDLIYEDGSFAQHSVNYHRLMLHDYLWSIRLGELHGQGLSAAVKTQVTKAVHWLYQIQDEQTGQVPLYGQTDGALVLPLNNCDYLDFRPIVQATHYLCTGIRCYASGAWDEDLLWLFGPTALATPQTSPPRSDWQAKNGGYYTLRAAKSFVFTRCTTYHDRPGQADMLHVDLWRQGENIAVDAGAYSYNAPAPWDNALASTAYHNTVTVDGLDQMARVGKFLWLPWLRSRMRARQTSPQGQIAYWEGEHDGYCRLPAPVRHRRSIVRIGEETWLVLDALVGSAAHTYRLHWLLPDLPYIWQPSANNLQLNTRAGPYHVQIGCTPGSGASSLVRADDQSPRGWRAAYYHARTPALSLALATKTDQVLCWSLFSPTDCQLSVDDHTIDVKATEWQATLHRSPDSKATMLTQIKVAGAQQDSLRLQ